MQLYKCYINAIISKWTNKFQGVVKPVEAFVTRIKIFDQKKLFSPGA